MEILKAFINYLFNSTPGAEFKYYIPLTILSGLLICGSIIASIIYKQRKKHDFAYKRLFKKLSSRLIIFGIIFLVLIAVRHENIPYFSIRIFIYATIGFLAYTTYKYIKTFFVDYPKEKAFIPSPHAENPQNKYLPNKGKKK